MENITYEGTGQVREIYGAVETSESMRFAQGHFLDELPGAAFAVITLIWVILSFAHLIWRELPPDTIAHLRALAEAVLGSHAMALVSRLGGAASFAKTVHGYLDPRTPA